MGRTEAVGADEKMPGRFTVDFEHIVGRAAEGGNLLGFGFEMTFIFWMAARLYMHI